ncbi:hypothetical protein ABFS83_14G174400 [Erythranthe nasuta]
MMISLEQKVTMQRNHEASIISLQTKARPFTPQHNITYSKCFPDFQDTSHASQSVGNVPEPERPLNNELLECSGESPQRPVYNLNSGTWSLYSDSNQTPLCQANPFHGLFNPYAVKHRIQCAPVHMVAQAYPYDYQFQDFQYFVVIDFEATCDKGKPPYPQEIIEFPSVIVSSITGQLEACFQTYVKPTCNQLLTDFCKDLTGIEQTQVDRGILLSEALLRHDKWLEKKGIKNANFAVVTWSDWDCRVMLETECRIKKIRKPPYFNRWINLKLPFQEVFGSERCNLKEAVEKSGLTWQGRAHCGLDDAKNTARLLALLMHRGFKFSITNSLVSQSSENDSTRKPSQESPIFVPTQQAQKTEHTRFCYCGVKSGKGMIRKPGPKQGSVFFGCGNWTAARGALCQYFEWDSQ